MTGQETAATNSTYKKLAVQWLSGALCFVLCVKFSAGRKFSSPKSPTSCSCKPLVAIAFIF